MDQQDYYSTLGVRRDADAKHIKKEYRKLARKYHPDVNQDAAAELKFKKLGEAYDVLKDPKKRKAYDAHGANWEHGAEQAKYRQQQQRAYQGGPRTSRASGFGGGGSQGAEYSDFFESMFGGQGGDRSHFQQQGQNVDTSITIPLEDAYTGSSRSIAFQLPQRTSNGQLEYQNKTINVKIPKGIKAGGKIRLKGQGGPGGNGGPAGDMYIKIDIAKHADYQVDGADVYTTLPVAPWEAALGAKVNVPTPTGTIKLSIPKGATSGKKLRLKGKGIPAKLPGDFYVKLQIVLPPADNEETIDLYKQMQALNFNPREGSTTN